MTSNLAEIPFGHFCLSPWREKLRRLGERLPRNGFGRRGRSIVRRMVTAGAREPYDIEVFPQVRARVYPRTNVCEKRVFAAPQLYDWAERRALSEALATNTAEPFIFVDLGANVGVYTLWMVSEARRQNRLLKALAVEPDPETFKRLTMNLSLSAANDVSAIQCAVAARDGSAQIIAHADNRGQHRVELDRKGEAGVVAVLSPVTLFNRQGIERIDAMKIDLEGLDHDVLSACFAGVPTFQWPSWIVVEAGKQADAPVIALCQQHGYRLHERTKLNAILYKPAAKERTN